MASRELFSLGKLYPSDFLRPDQQPRSEPVELTLVRDDMGLVRLKDVAPKECMYGQYWYRSGINNTMRGELKSIVDSILSLRRFETNEVWLDIACNDGTLLSFVPKEFTRVGIDPADDSFKNESKQHADVIIQDYFSADVYHKSIRYKASVVTSIAMFYDVANPVEFIKGVHEILAHDGMWVMQLSYTPLMIEQIAFDNICHEHIFYYGFDDLARLLYDNGFMVFDCQLNDINGGSMRLYLVKKGISPLRYGSEPFRYVCATRIESLAQYERKESKLDEDRTWHKFFKRINELKRKTKDFITEQKRDGKTIWAYAASTKGNTLLQYFGLDNTLISGVADKNFDKWGLRTIGTDIPIYPESEMRKQKPDYVLVLAWHFITEFIEREREYLRSGGKFIVPCPSFQIIIE